MGANIGYEQEFTGIQSPFTVKVDKTLTKTGWAADSDVTGTAISDTVTLAQGFDGRITQAESDASNALNAAGAAEQAVVSKQDILVSGTNIKTVDGESILGEGDLKTINYHTFNNSWVTNDTTEAFCQSIVADNTTKAGMTYLGIIRCSDLPGLVQGECVVEILSQGSSNGKDMHLVLTSLEVAPYHWEYNYAWINGSYKNTGWIGYQPALPNLPSQDGIYTLLATVEDGTVTYSWLEV